MNKNAENVVLVHTGVLDNNKNKREGRDIYTNASNCGAKIKTFEEIESNDVGADASVRLQTTDYRKSMLKNPTSNLKYQTSNSAITLIALIITIIVLLILAGVTLNMVIGENGIINKAQLARTKTNESNIEEEKKIEEIENLVNNYNNSRENYDKKIW